MLSLPIRHFCVWRFVPALGLVSMTWGCGLTSSDNASGGGGGLEDQKPGSGGAESGGAESGGAEFGGAEFGGVTVGDGDMNEGGGSSSGGAASGGAASGAGGATTSGGSGGEGGSGGGPQGDCIDVTGGGIEPWRDLQITGNGFDADDGSRVRVISRTNGDVRFGIAEVTINGGEFDVTLGEALNDGLYVDISVYIDRNDDDICDGGEQILDFTTGIVADDYLIELSPSELCVPESGEVCGERPEPFNSCKANGFELAEALPCE